MARIHGRRGRVYVGLASDTAAAEPVAFLNSWEISFATDNADVTAFEDSNKTYVAGLPDASGSFSGWYDDATAQTYIAAKDGLARKFYLYPSTLDVNEYFFGTILVDFNASGNMDGGVTVSASWNAASVVAKVPAT